MTPLYGGDAGTHIRPALLLGVASGVTVGMGSGVCRVSLRELLRHSDIALTANTYGNRHQPHHRPDLDALDRTPLAAPEEADG